VLRVGAPAFAALAREAGADAVLLTDLPPDESPEVWRAFDDAGLDTVLLVAPTTPAGRLPLLIQRCRGFVYCLPRTGVTGGSAGEAGSLDGRIDSVRRGSSLPVAVGFGISSADQARVLRGRVDAVVVGAAFMRAAAGDPPGEVPDRVERLARELAGALE